MNQRYDDRNSSRDERDSDRERDRRNEQEARRERSSGSFHPGGFGFDDTHEHSQQYGQREPYSTSGSGGGTYGASGYGPYRGEGQGGYQGGRDSNRSYSPEEHGRYYERANRGDWGRRPDESRYSESQYGQQRFDRGRYGGSEGRREGYSAGYGDDGRRYADRGNERPPYRGQGSGYEDPFEPSAPGPAEQQSYFGTGAYGEGGAGFGGGYGEYRGVEANRGSDWDRRYSGYGRGDSRSGEQQQQRPGLLSRLFGRGPKGYQRSDERLREDISERLMQAGNVDSSEVTVNVVSGAVTLEGTVPDRYMKHCIEDVVDACPGVQDIDNRIRVDRGWANRANDEWNRNRGSQGSSTGVGTTGTSGSGGSSASGGTLGTTSGTTSYGSSGSSGSSGGSGASSGSTPTRRKDS